MFGFDDGGTGALAVVGLELAGGGWAGRGGVIEDGAGAGLVLPPLSRPHGKAVQVDIGLTLG